MHDQKCESCGRPSDLEIAERFLRGLERLSELEREIVIRRYLEVRSRAVVAKEVGVSQERIRQRESKVARVLAALLSV